MLLGGSERREFLYDGHFPIIMPIFKRINPVGDKFWGNLRIAEIRFHRTNDKPMYLDNFAISTPLAGNRYDLIRRRKKRDLSKFPKYDTFSLLWGSAERDPRRSDMSFSGLLDLAIR